MFDWTIIEERETDSALPKHSLQVVSALQNNQLLLLLCTCPPFVSHKMQRRLTPLPTTIIAYFIPFSLQFAAGKRIRSLCARRMGKKTHQPIATFSHTKTATRMEATMFMRMWNVTPNEMETLYICIGSSRAGQLPASLNEIVSMQSIPCLGPFNFNIITICVQQLVASHSSRQFNLFTHSNANVPGIERSARTVKSNDDENEKLDFHSPLQLNDDLKTIIFMQ